MKHNSVTIQRTMPLSDYERISMIGSGGFADAYLVKLKSDDRQKFVLKEMTFGTADEQKDCQTEVEMLKHLDHPHIVAFKESFLLKKIIYLVMEHCAGGDMGKLLKAQSQSSYLPEQQIVHWTLEILDALQYLHGRPKPILHRDLKPANIFLTEKYIIKLGDFGISKELAHFSDHTTTICGTPLYLSPEIFRQEPYDHKCDIWSLGCCVYEMMTFKSAVNPLLLAVLNMASINPMPDNYSKDLVDIVREMLTVNVQDRPSAAEANAKLIQLKSSDTFSDGLRFVASGQHNSSSSDYSNGYDSDDATLKEQGPADSLVSHHRRLKRVPSEDDDHDTFDDMDETLKNKKQAVVRVWSPEKILKKYGYQFNSKGHLQSIDKRESFKYEVSSNRSDNERRYQEIAKAVTEYVCEQLEKELSMHRIYLPLDCQAGEPYTYIYVTPDVFTNADKLLILIGGTDPVRPGIWSRKAVINDSIDAGSQIPCIKRAMKEGYAVLVLNQNQTYFEVDGFKVKIRGNETAQRHALYVWDKILTNNTKVKNVAFLTHTFGGSIAAHLAIEREISFRKLVFAMAMCHFRHEEILQDAPQSVLDLFSKLSKNWIANSKPLDTPLKKKPLVSFMKDKAKDCVNPVSAGDQRPEWTVCSSRNSVFQFLEEQYRLRLQSPNSG